ncbi:Ig-like domain repeat protein [Haloferax sp. Atlit-19N]|uniref:Ig-like domain repeat protein n=1 Tax=Haloferax sp. Atlit-19N TaxID=2077201 RepID=UPI001F48C988|nr:Ig-like domain repeat protein [Haloferax sp. Atlit-19N]
MPVSATSTNVAIGSENDTDTELQSGTLEGVSVTGAGAGATVRYHPTDIVDDFEDGDVSEYTQYGGGTGTWGTDTTSFEGSLSLKGDSGSTRSDLISTTGLGRYPSAGDSFSTRFRYEDTQVHYRLYWAAQSSQETPDGYNIRFNFDENQVELQKSNGSDVILDSASVDPPLYQTEWTKIEVDWQTDGTMTVTWVDSAGSEILQLQGTDSAFTSGGIGFRHNNKNENAVAFWDDFRVTGGSSSGTYTSGSHVVDNATGGSVEITTLIDAEVTVTWQQNVAGTWSNITNTTHTTSGVKTADISGATSSEVRVRVDFEPTGQSPEAELDRDFVEFTNHAPTASSPSLSGGEVVHDASPNLSVVVDDDEFSSVQGDLVTVEWFINGSKVGEKNVSSSGAVNYSDTKFPDGNHSWHVELTDSYGGSLTSPTWSFEVGHFDPSVTALSPPDNSTQSTRDISLSADLTDSDFAFEGDELTAEFIVDGSVVGTDTLISNRTVSTSYTMQGGTASWSVRVTDDYGNVVTSETRTIRSPSTLTIRNVSTGEPITGSAQVTAKLYSGELIFTKNTSDGTIDLTGVPVERGYIIEVTVDGYVTRTVAIESVFEQGDVYLLPETADTVYQEMTLNDQTGDFEASSTVLYVERPIERNGTIEWRVVTGDYFGADSVFKTTLEQDQRYRLVIENDDGDRRELGAYIAAVNGTAPLDVGTIQWQAPKGDTYQWDAFVNEENAALRVMFSDPEDETTSFNVVVHERGNASNVIFESSATNLSTFQRTQPLSQSQLEQDWAVNITLERNSQTTTINEPISSAASIRTPVPIDTRWATLAGLVLLVALSAAFPSTLSRVGAVAVVSVATGITWLGWVDIPMSVIGLSGAVALLGLAASFNSY